MFLLFMGLIVSSSAAVAESIITGIGLGTGLYCASRTQKTTAMPKKAR